MIDILQMDFMQNAILAGLLASLACGALGSLVVVNRIVFISGGIAHTAFGGVGLAFFLGISPLLGAVGFALAAAALTGWISLANRERADTVIGVMWALGMAIGVVLLGLTPGYQADLMSYLFGSILAVPTSDLYLMAGLDILVVVLVAWQYTGFLAISFDQEFAASRGVAVRGLYFMLILLIALAVVILIRVAGLILIIALLTIPPYIAENYCRSLKGMMLVSTVLCAVFCLAGLWLSYELDITSGASIILVAGAAFFISLAVKRLPGVSAASRGA